MIYCSSFDKVIILPKLISMSVDKKGCDIPFFKHGVMHITNTSLRFGIVFIAHALPIYSLQIVQIFHTGPIAGVEVQDAGKNKVSDKLN